jgi:hypothetical protein
MKNGELVGAHGNAPAILPRFHRSIPSCWECVFTPERGRFAMLLCGRISYKDFAEWQTGELTGVHPLQASPLFCPFTM